MHIGGSNYTNFENLRIFGSATTTGLRGSTGIVRFAGLNANEGTLTITTLDGDRYWELPNKSGRFPIMGSFAIQLPLISATTDMQSTVVTVGGITAVDALVVQVNGGTSTGYGAVNLGASGATSRILFRALPGAGNITLTFANLGVSTGYVEYVCSYVAVR